jgi:hypothetical protein
MTDTNNGLDGTYTLHGLPTRTYRVRAARSSNKLPYTGEDYNNTYDTKIAQRVTVTAGQNTPGINFSLGLGVSISGGYEKPVSRLNMLQERDRRLTRLWKPLS